MTRQLLRENCAASSGWQRAQRYKRYGHLAAGWGACTSTCPDGSRSPNGFSFTAAAVPALALACAAPSTGTGTVTLCRYYRRLALQGDEDGSYGECPASQLRLSQRTAAGAVETRRRKSRRMTRRRRARDEERHGSLAAAMGGTELLEWLGVVNHRVAFSLLLPYYEAMPFSGPTWVHEPLHHIKCTSTGYMLQVATYRPAWTGHIIACPLKWAKVLLRGSKTASGMGACCAPLTSMTLVCQACSGPASLEPTKDVEHIAEAHSIAILKQLSLSTC